MLIHSGRFFTTLFVVRFTIGFLGHKARGTSTSRFAFFNTDGVSCQPPHSTEVIVSTVSIVFFGRSRKSAFINALLRLFTWLCYNLPQLACKPIVVNLNTTLNLIDFSYAAFLQGASGRLHDYVMLCYVGCRPPTSFPQRSRFLFSPKRGYI